MSINIRYPNITGISEREQLAQIKSYLYQLVEQLNIELPTIGSGDSAQASNTYAVQGGDLSYYELRTLILQEIQKVEALFDELSKNIDANIGTVVNTAIEEAIASGDFDGEDGVSVTHSWEGTVLTVTSASGTSSADLKGEPGKAGEKGDPGAPGYSPMRGTDYWTEADIAQIKTYVDEAILGGAW